MKELAVRIVKRMKEFKKEFTQEEANEIKIVLDSLLQITDWDEECKLTEEEEEWIRKFK